MLAVGLAGSVAAGPYEDGTAAAERGDYDTAVRLIRPLADQGDSSAKTFLESDEFSWRRQSENARVLAVLLAKTNFSRVEHDGLTARKSEAG